MDFTTPDGKRVHLIGDPHLGKKFEVGVPMHRRGEREARQLRHFIQELDYDADMVVVVGDLFEHPYVGYAIVDVAASALRSAIERNDRTTYVVIAGNHDMPRNTTTVGAFHDLHDRLVGRADNLHLFKRPAVVDGVAFFPWEWDRRADEQVEDVKHEKVHTAIGHWDFTAFGDRDDHLAPVEALTQAFGPTVRLFSGHLHRAGEYRVHGTTVVCTGSLEPYAHDQDVSGTLYVTMPLSDVLAAPTGTFKNKCVRVILKPGESPPEIDCLALTHIREGAAIDESIGHQITLSTNEFSWTKILADSMKSLDPVVQDFIRERLPYEESHSSQ